MKTAYLLSISVLVVLMTTVVGVSANDAASVDTVQPSAPVDTEMLSQLNSQPTFSDSTLRRPF
ncbi:MAG TPA: hypothetical protein VGD45_21835 [Steroidobacter sp.]|uniref:hypothetical protein n=1 Tax=Steroidobacter sp. TaxID=1978227 RepID=UPI002ED7B8E9